MLHGFWRQVLVELVGQELMDQISHLKILMVFDAGAPFVHGSSSIN